VDNNSLDDTATFLFDLAKRFKNIVLLTIRSKSMNGDCSTIAAARNAGLAFINSGWILVVDDDEYISDEGLDTLRNLACTSKHLAYFLPWNTYENDGKLRVEDYKLSFFRGGHGISYEGLIHENPTVSIRKMNGSCGLAAVELSHFPANDTAFQTQKQANYLKALSSAIVLQPDCARIRWFLGLTYHKLGQYDEAKEHFMASAQMEKDVWHPIERINASFLLGWSYLRRRNCGEGKRWINHALRLYSTHRGDPEMAAFGKVLTALGHVSKVLNDPQAIDAIDPTLFFYFF
jgi:glycosyltransferase involved in cell wall biosynthesis